MHPGFSGKKGIRRYESKKKGQELPLGPGVDEAEKQAQQLLRIVHEVLSEWYDYLSRKSIYIDEWRDLEWWVIRVPRDLASVSRFMLINRWWENPGSFSHVSQVVWSLHRKAAEIEDGPVVERLAEKMRSFEELING